jgi:hypothetical protein
MENIDDLKLLMQKIITDALFSKDRLKGKFMTKDIREFVDNWFESQDWEL